MAKYIDVHGHMNFSAYETDREEVIKRAKDAGVVMISVGTQFDTSKMALDLAHSHENMYAVVGLHPIHSSNSYHDVQELGEGNREFTSRGETASVDAYLEMAKDPKTVAIGECGLDYYRLDVDMVEKQIQAFETMIDLGNEVDKPLMLHVRNGKNGKSAYADAYEMLRNRSKVSANLHFFAGDISQAKLFLDLGYSFSFNGVVTFARNYDEVIKYLPADRIMSETDCPYLSPVPLRGKRNEPVNVIEIVKKIAEIRSVSEDLMAKQILLNAEKFFFPRG
jgi:TatD DNase family protein